MYNVSADFLAAVRKNHTVTARAEFYRRGVSQGVAPIVAGEVTEDKTAEIRRTASLEFSTDSSDLIMPTKDNYTTSPLWPVGNEVKVWAGIQYSSGITEEVPMGVFRISRPKLKRRSGEFTLQVDAFDRSRQIKRARFTDIYQIAAGTDFATAIKTLIRNRMPSLLDTEFDFMPTNISVGSIYSTPWLVFNAQDDPWEKASDMARAIGAELFFDGDGKCVLRSEPNPIFTPSMFDYVTGEDCTFDELDRELDDELAYNGVIAVGQSTDNVTAIPRGEAWDDNPLSPSYYDPKFPAASEYGPVPWFFTSDYITTNDQARAAARGLLIGVTGVIENVSLSGIANPAHTTSDVVKIQDLTSGVDENYQLQAIRTGLGVEGGQSLTTKRRRTF